MRKVLSIALLSTGALAAVPANAVGTDYSTLTTAVDWSTAITGLMAVGAALALVLIARKGIKFILGMIR